MIKRIECKVWGRSWGVQYRWWVVRKALKLGVLGTVFKEPDGHISIVAEGEERDLEKFAHRLRKGPLFSTQDDIYVAWKEPTGEFEDFSIL